MTTFNYPQHPMGIEIYYCVNRATSEAKKPFHTVAQCFTCMNDGPELKRRHYTHCPCCDRVLSETPLERAMNMNQIATVAKLLEECQPLIESLYLDEHDKIAQGQVRGNHQEEQRLFELNEQIKRMLGR